MAASSWGKGLSQRLGSVVPHGTLLMDPRQECGRLRRIMRLKQSLIPCSILFQNIEMDKTPTLTSKISPLHCAPHAPTPNYPMICGTDKKGLPHRIMPIICNSFSHRVSFRVTTKIMFKKQGTATASAGKSTAKKVAAPSSILRPLVVCGSHTLSALYCFMFHPFFTI